MAGRGILDEVRYAAVRAFRELVPLEEDRVTLTGRTALQSFAYFVPYLFLAYLARRRDTHLMRILLLPTVVFMAIWGTWRYKSAKPVADIWIEWQRGLIALGVIGKAIRFAVSPEGMLKVGEKELPEMFESMRPAEKQNGRDASDSEPDSSEEDGPLQRPPLENTNVLAQVLPKGFMDACELGLSMRGIGFQYGKDCYIPPYQGPKTRRDFILEILLWQSLRMFYTDVWDTIEKTIPGVAQPGGTIFLPYLPPLQRYAVSTFLQAGHGRFIAVSMGSAYGICAFIGVEVLGQSPEWWPPVSSDLWTIRSLHQFWSSGWHQLLRDTFLTYGGYTGRWVAGDFGLVFGTFLASGLFHDIAMTVTGTGIRYTVTWFFLFQAVGILGEKVYQKVTGRRIGGALGVLWTLFFVVGFGQICTNSWFNRGLAQGVIFPAEYSPTRVYILPWVRRHVFPLFPSSFTH